MFKKIFICVYLLSLYACMSTAGLQSGRTLKQGELSYNLSLYVSSGVGAELGLRYGLVRAWDFGLSFNTGNGPRISAKRMLLGYDTPFAMSVGAELNSYTAVQSLYTSYDLTKNLTLYAQPFVQEAFSPEAADNDANTGVLYSQNVHGAGFNIGISHAGLHLEYGLLIPFKGNYNVSQITVGLVTNTTNLEGKDFEAVSKK